MSFKIEDIDKVTNDLTPGSVAVLGLPVDANSSFMRGPALAPRAITETLHSGSGNLCIEDGTDLKEIKTWHELGELDLSDNSRALTAIESAVAAILAREARVLSLGGDHSVTLPILRAYAKKYPGLTVIQLDAHPDLYDELDGNRYSHATPMLRSLEEGLMVRLIQAGIRAETPQQRERAGSHGVETIQMRQWPQDLPSDIEGPVYLTLDMDCLDPAFAPGVSHHEPGGFSTRDVLRIIEKLDINLVGADIVELNPNRDPVGITAAVAVKFLKEILGKMLKAGG